MTSNNFEPGAAKYGNFIDYYKFNPSDKRINILPSQFWQLLKTDGSKVLCLDVGCNSGELTAALFKKLSSQIKVESLKLIGIDIDNILIERACLKYYSDKLSFICGDITKEDFKNTISNLLATNSLKSFSVVFMFSVTMWIHLNYGDETFKDVLKYLSESTDFLVVEAQPWKCYKTAVKRMKKYKMDHFPEFNKLKMRETVESDIDKHLTECCGMTVVYESHPSHWGRRIKLFKRLIDHIS